MTLIGVILVLAFVFIREFLGRNPAIVANKIVLHGPRNLMNNYNEGVNEGSTDNKGSSHRGGSAETGGDENVWGVENFENGENGDNGGNGDNEVAKLIRDKVPTPETSTVCYKKILVLDDLIAETRFQYPFNHVSRVPDTEENIFQGSLQCPSSHGWNCTFELTFSANYTRHMHGKDAVVLNIAPLSTLKNVDALYANIDQPHLMVFFSLESPERVYEVMKLKNLLDLPVHEMWSYHASSFPYRPYGVYNPNVPRPRYWEKVRGSANKTGLVLWMGSNCYRTYWPRLGFVLELQKHVSVDIYGECGDKRCPIKGPGAKEKCYKVRATYKFYLALENSECEYYITEKLWLNALKNGVVPIVYGARRKDYERLLPPNSFIYAGDYDSIQSLADYLQELDKRPDLYQKYLEWYGSVYPYRGINMQTFCGILPLFGKLEKGNLEKKPLKTLPWFNTCRIPAANATLQHELLDWQPW